MKLANPSPASQVPARTAKRVARGSGAFWRAACLGLALVCAPACTSLPTGHAAEPSSSPALPRVAPHGGDGRSTAALGEGQQLAAGTAEREPAASPTSAALGESPSPDAAAGEETPATPLEARFEFEAPKLGTTFRLVFFATDAEQAERAAAATLARIDALDAILSDYDPNSEVSRLSALSWSGAPTVDVPISAELFAVLRCAEDLATLTDGTFDVTVGPFVRLWRRARRQEQLPTEAQLATARAAVGFQHVQLDAETRSARLCTPNMQLDLGGIAKGFILDESLRVLEAHGITRALLDGGGDLVASGPPVGRTAWRVVIEPHPPGPRDESAGAELPLAAGTPEVIDLVHGAVATSGDAYQFIVIDGQRYSHLIDPATGSGLTTAASATVRVVGRPRHSAMLADAWASALAVMGPERGLAAIEAQRGIEARCTSAERTLQSPGF